MVQIPETDPRRAAPGPPERIWSWSLVAFLVAVAAVIAFGLVTRWPSPDLPGAIELLEDGDLDGGERNRLLKRVFRLSAEAGSEAGEWAGVLAAMALGDGEGFRERESRLRAAAAVSAAAAVAPTREHGFDLGDAMLANVRRALEAEFAGDTDSARTSWRQVAAQARLTAHRLGAAVAAERIGG